MRHVAFCCIYSYLLGVVGIHVALNREEKIRSQFTAFYAEFLIYRKEGEEFYWQFPFLDN